MKLSDYVAKFLAEQGIRHVFAVTGGAAAHLIDSIAKTQGIEYVCPQHEQAGAMAADAYARVTGNLGAAIATSGPGATNLLTGICSAYYDSIPVLYITGQVATFRQKKDTGVRQIGFQETDVIAMFRHVTNYSVQIRNEKDIRYELEKACYLAKDGRPGPVLVDIPDNLQRAAVDPKKLKGFVAPCKKNIPALIDKQIDSCIKMLSCADRPVVILGGGVRLAGAIREAKRFINKQKLPFAPTWAVADILPSRHACSIGTFGTHGTRYANFAVQNADLILSIGSRLDTKATGSPISTFARGAKKIIVDIDKNELGKFKRFNLDVDVLIHCDAKVFLQKLNAKIQRVKKKNISAWFRQISTWKSAYPICPSRYCGEKKINPYVFVKTLSRKCKNGDHLVVDTGCCLAWMMQGFEFKKDQRLFHDWNNTAMGWALPASIGASFAKDRASIICVTGDGSLHMNLQELATIIRHQLPIKIFLVNNDGYSMIRQTQDQWLGSCYVASSVKGGLPEINFSKIARSYGFHTLDVSRNSDLEECVQRVFKKKGPVFCNVHISSEHRVIPQVKYGRPNEDLEPLLNRKEFLRNMIIKPCLESIKMP
ncbi:MAG TPA: thiamine pyrophosphate-binding protein [Candidatus Omnitrophota bacterium]|nr:thiamine pyrophosphate-binding protein [Candidatus Omnitrophota bacterium]